MSAKTGTLQTVLIGVADLVSGPSFAPVIAGISDVIELERHLPLETPQQTLNSEDTLSTLLVSNMQAPTVLVFDGVEDQYRAFADAFAIIEQNPAYLSAVAKVGETFQPGSDAWIELNAALAKMGIDPFAAPQTSNGPFGFVGAAIGAVIVAAGIGVGIAITCVGTVGLGCAAAVVVGGFAIIGVADFVRAAAEAEVEAQINFAGGNTADAVQPTNDWVLTTRRPLASSTSFDTCWVFFTSYVRPGWTASGCFGPYNMRLIGRQGGYYIYLDYAISGYGTGACNSRYTVTASARVQPGITVKESMSYSKTEDTDNAWYWCP